MRCDICDSSTLENNLEVPIIFWVRMNNGYNRCSVCYTSVNETKLDYEAEEEFKTVKEWEEHLINTYQNNVSSGKDKE